MQKYDETGYYERRQEMIKAAKDAGYEVDPCATAQDVADAWKSKKYGEIIWQVHGTASGLADYSIQETQSGWTNMTRALPEIFNPNVGFADKLTIVSCNPSQVVDKWKDHYKKRGVELQRAHGPVHSDGCVDTVENYRVIKNYINKTK